MIYYGKELCHSGVKGQKWGVRNYQNQDGTWTLLGKRRRREENFSEDYKKAHDGKTYRELSTQELADRNKRFTMEKNYRNNLAEEPTRQKEILNKGKKAYNALIVGIPATVGAITTAYAFYKTFGEKIVDRIRDAKVMKNGGLMDTQIIKFPGR